MTKAALILLSLLVTGCETGPWKDFHGDTRPASIPRDVRDFIIDAQGCGHFSGEEPYDAERAAFLKKSIEEMCDGIEMRHAKLTVKYADNKDALAVLDEVQRGIFG